MNIKYSKNVAWLEDYILSAKQLVPIEQIKRVRGYKVTLGLKETQEAAIHVANNAATKFKITIKLYDQEMKDGIIQYVPVHLARVLDSLAHELAHLVPGCWDHSPEHFLYQAKILQRFYKVLKKKNIDDTWELFTKYAK